MSIERDVVVYGSSIILAFCYGCIPPLVDDLEAIIDVAVAFTTQAGLALSQQLHVVKRCLVAPRLTLPPIVSRIGERTLALVDALVVERAYQVDQGGAVIARRGCRL